MFKKLLEPLKKLRGIKEERINHWNKYLMDSNALMFKK